MSAEAARAVQRCGSCQAPIVWVITARGRPLPLDADPHPKGNVWLDKGHVTIGGNPPPGTTLWKSHFATCPEAGQWRRK